MFFTTNTRNKTRMSHNTALLCIIIPKTLANAIGKENITYVKWEGRNLTVFIDDTKELSKKNKKNKKTPGST